MFGVTSQGFLKPTDTELEEELSQDFRDQFGANITLAAQTFLGQQLAIYKRREAQLWDVLENIYYSLYVNTATGVNLDNAAFPFERSPAKVSSTTLTFTGNDGAFIPEGTIAETADGVQFVTQADASIFDSSGGTGTVDVDAVSVETGIDQNFPVNSITELPVVPTDVDSVTNSLPAIGGKDIESDAAFRARIKEESQEGNASSVPAIRQALLAVQGVVQANVTENNTDIYVNGIPPHSIQCVVSGSATDADIATAIYNTKPGGIGTFGDEQYTVVEEGEDFPINFDRSVTVPIYVDINLTVNDTWNEDESPDLVRERVLDYIGGVDPAGVEYDGLAQGVDVLVWKINASLFNLESKDELGILDVYSEVSRESDPSSGESGNLAIALKEEAITDFTFITVNVTVI